MKRSLCLSVIGACCVASGTAYAVPPARRTVSDSEGARCPLVCVVNVGPRLTRGSLYGVVVASCHQKSPAAERRGNPSADCPQVIQMVPCN